MATLSPNILPLMGLNPSGDLGPFTVFRTKRLGVVWFPRAPPDKPASYLQRRQRNRWRFAARAWSGSPISVRTNWLLAARLAGLTISGYNLWIYHKVTCDDRAIQTIERLTGLSLL